MLDYFYKCEYPLFSEEVRTELREYALANDKLFSKHGDSREGRYDGNHIMVFFPKANKTIESLVKQCVLPVYTVIIKHPPGQVVIKHSDGIAWSRTTVLGIPLTIAEHSPTYFWESYESTEPAAVLTYDNTLPVVLNTSRIHSLENTTNDTRFTFQFCFKHQIDVIVQHLQNNSLFNAPIV